MSLINVNNLTFGYDGALNNVFENVSFSIDTDWKLGLIGRNGKGKKLDPHRSLLWLLRSVPVLSQSNESWAENFLPANAPQECHVPP